MKIWRCPTCNSGVRAPARMRRDNALRYCLKCTAKTGKLVERVCPSAQAERERRAAERAEADAKKRDRAAAKSASYAQTERGKLEAKAREWLKLDAFKDGLAKYRHRTPTFEIRLSGERSRTWLERREEPTKPDGLPGNVTYIEKTERYARPKFSSGHAWYGQGRFVVTAGTDEGDALATILHEIAHLAAWEHGHGPGWRSVFADAVQEVTGERPVMTGSKREAHDACGDVMRKWLTNSGCTSPAPALPSDVP